MGNNSISHKIDAYAQANLKALKQEEAKTGRKMTKFDIAQYMLQHGKLNKNEYANWMNTSEGFNAQAMTKTQITALRQGNVWGFAGYGGGEESYLDSMTSFAQKTPVEKQNKISGHQMKLNETIAERKKKAAEINNHIKNQRLMNHKKTAEEQKFKAHIDSVNLSAVDANKTASQLTREIEQQNVEMMSHDDRKKFIMDKFQDAAAKKDFSGMKNALSEFNSYMCKYIDDKVGVTDVKDAIKEYSGLNELVDYVDNLVDDGDATNLSKLETAWNITKGLGDAVDGFIGAEGLEMVGALGTASKVATVANAGKYFAVATQSYFGVEGSQLIGAGLAHAQTAETEDEARLAGSEIGMGTIMLGGAVKSAKVGYKNIKGKTPSADFASKLANTKIPRKKLGVTVKTKLTQEEINNLIENCQHGFITDGKPIPNYEARIEAVLNNPKELAIIAENKNTVAGIWRAIQDPLDSTIEKNPELFADTKVKITSDSNVAKNSIKADIDPDAQLRTRLTEFKGPDGKPFLSKTEVENLIENCQHGFITDGKPIPNYEAKIEAVLNNPEEIASISGWKSRSAGIWRAIQDPLSSTVEANPKAFGVKPKAEVKVKSKPQTKPSISPEIRNGLIQDLKDVKYNKQVTIDTMDKYPEFVEELVNFKVDGKQFFSKREINDIIYNCLSGNDGLKATPERIRNILNNPSEISFMRDECQNKAVGLWVALFR